ncbi:MAG: leucine-rich repeat protein [Bacteroidales bacterium]|nr:leucine-rich repeat protein [Bacteroidales bacterium]
MVLVLFCGGLGARAQTTSTTINGITYTHYTGYYNHGTVAGAVVTDVSNTVSDADIRSQVTISGTTYTVTHIGHGAFRSCGATLKKVTFPSTITTVVGNPFGMNNDIDGTQYPTATNTSISLNELVWNAANATLEGVSQYYEDECSSYQNYMDVKVTKLTFGSTCQTIPQLSRKGSTCVKNPSYLKSSVATIDIAYGVASISGYAFYGFTALTDLTLPNTVQEIKESAFEGCGSLSEVTLPSALYTLEDNAFANTRIVIVTLPQYLQTLGNAFAGCTYLSSIQVNPSNVYYKSDNGVLYDYGMTNLICYPPAKIGTSYTIPSTVTRISQGAFLNTKLSTVTIPNSVSKIGANAFQNSALTSVTFPDDIHLDSIHDNTFAKCSNLTSIEIPEGVTYIGRNVFSSSMTKITLPSTLKKVGILFYESTESNIKLETIICNAINPPQTSAYMTYEEGSYEPEDNSEVVYKQTTVIVPCVAYDNYKNIAEITSYPNYTYYRWKYFDKLTKASPVALSTITKDTYVENCDCYTFADEITITNNGSLAFADYTAAATALSGKNVVLERILTVGKWSLIGNISSETTYEFLDKNYGYVDAETVYKDNHHAFTANAYDYTKNAWYDNYQRHNDATPENYGAFFAYPFVNALVSGDELYEDYVVLPQKINSSDINLGDVTFTASNTGDASTVTEFEGRWFALSNPYLGLLNAEKFHTDNASQIQGSSIYAYDNEKEDWEYINFTGMPGNDWVFRPAAGFMVASASDKQDLNITFSTSQILTESDKTKFYFEYDKQQPITFTLTANGVEKQMFARISETSQDGFDGEDSYVMVSENNDAITPYFVVDNRSIIDNHFKNLPYTCDINFNSYHGATAELSVKNIPENIEVSIIDCQNDNQQTVLTEENSFVFYADEGTNKGRYKVMFAKKNAGIEDIATANNNVEITNRNNEITIHGSDLRNAEIINALGQTVYSQNLSGNDATVKFNGTSGAYIVKIQTAKGTKSGKIIVK